jgi:hypothetical protein
LIPLKGVVRVTVLQPEHTGLFVSEISFLGIWQPESMPAMSNAPYSMAYRDEFVA